MCQSGDCAAGIFPLRDFFNNPEKEGLLLHIGRDNTLQSPCLSCGRVAS